MILDSTPSGLPPHAVWFGEDQARYLLETSEPEAVLAAAKAAGIPACRLGTVSGVALTLTGAGAISVRELSEENEAWLPGFMGTVEPGSDAGDE